MKRVRRLHRWWYDRRRVVVVPNGRTVVGGRVVHLRAPRSIAIEEIQDIRADRDAVLTQSPRRARRIRRGWRKALYRVDEPLQGRAASGHWVLDYRSDGAGGLLLVAVALVPFPGFRVR